MSPARHVVMALQFPPRGGSAQVVRYLAPEIAATGWSVSLVAGSVGGPGELGYAPEFFAIPGVFFTGWRGHDELPTGLGCADVFVSPSVGEAFGQVIIEAMACGLPVVAAASGGPLSFVNDYPTAPNGWLVTPDDEVALAGALA